MTNQNTKIRKLQVYEKGLVYESKKLTGKPSIDKPWLKYYSKEAIGSELPKMTVYDYLYENNKKYNGAIALNYFGRKISYDELFRKIDDTARGFLNLGVKPGEVVTVCAPNVPEVVYSFYALDKIGAIANMIHPLSGDSEMKHYLEESKSRVMVMFDGSYPNLKDAFESNTTNIEKVINISAANSLPYPINLGFKLQNYVSTIKGENVKVPNNNMIINWNKFIKDGRTIKNIKEHPYKEKEPKFMLHTGGTTGTPKAVLLTDDNFNAMVHQYKVAANFDRGETMLTILPIFVGFGLCNCLHMPLSFGIETVLVPKFEAKDYHKYIEKYKPNHIMSIPDYWNAMISNKNFEGIDLSQFKYLVSGGDNMKESKILEINEFLKKHNCTSKITNGYGMTEGISSFTYTFPNAYKIGTAGIPLVKTNQKIISTETGEELSYNQTGEICFSGPTIMNGYLNNTDETKNIISVDEENKRWIHTGDIGFIDEDGILHFCDRIKRIYISGGTNDIPAKVFPDRIEKVISESGLIKDCAVLGVPDEEVVNVSKAYLIKKNASDDDNLLIEEINNVCTELLPKYYVPKEYEIIDAFPRTKLGKVNYKKLLEDSIESKKNKSLIKKI